MSVVSTWLHYELEGRVVRVVPRVVIDGVPTVILAGWLPKVA